jgi:hypothetical protein
LAKPTNSGTVRFIGSAARNSTSAGAKLHSKGVW